MTQLSLIVAMDQNRLIGRGNQLPWHMPADLAYFKRTTMGKPIVMGRRTYESIGRPLPGRRNIVVSRDPDFTAAGAEVVGSIDRAVELCSGDEEIMLIGGASLYAQTLDRADRLYLTVIHHAFEGDTWFPELDPGRWREENRRNFDADGSNPHAYSLIDLVREI